MIGAALERWTSTGRQPRLRRHLRATGAGVVDAKAGAVLQPRPEVVARELISMLK
jgi:hypothetical protein